MLMAKAATFLPLGQIAFRINVLSAVCASVTVALSYLLMLRFAGDRSGVTKAAAAAGALLVGCGSTMWLHATSAEVYTPNLLAVVVYLWLLTDVIDTGSVRKLRAAAVLTGLAAGLHAVFALVAAAGWAIILLHRRQTLKRDLGWTAVLVATGMLVLAYLPIRAAQEPWRNWGDPSTVGALWDHLTGARIRQAFSAEMGGKAAFDINFTQAIAQLWSQVSWAAVGAALGALLLARRKPRFAALLLGIWLADLAFTVLLNPMGMQDRQTGLIATFATSVAFVVGMSWIGKRWLATEFRLYSAPLLSFVLAFSLTTPAVFSEGRVRDSRRLYHPIDQGDRTFDQAPPESLLLVSSDDLASATTYLQGVENRRPDCTTIVKQHIADQAYVEQLHSIHGDAHLTDTFMAALAEGGETRQLLSVLLAENTERRPVYWQLGDVTVDNLVAGDLRLSLPMGRLFGPKIRNMQGYLIGVRSRWRRLSGGRWPTSTLESLAQTYSILGGHVASQGDRRLAMLAVGEAYMTYRDSAHVTNNYAMLLQLEGHHAAAENRFREVVQMRPGYALGWYNLGTTLFNKGDLAATSEAFAEAARLGIDAARVAKMTWYMAITHANRGQLDLALVLLVKAEPFLRGSAQREARAMMADLQRRILAESAP